VTQKQEKRKNEYWWNEAASRSIPNFIHRFLQKQRHHGNSTLQKCNDRSFLSRQRDPRGCSGLGEKLRAVIACKDAVAAQQLGKRALLGNATVSQHKDPVAGANRRQAMRN